LSTLKAFLELERNGDAKVEGKKASRFWYVSGKEKGFDQVEVMRDVYTCMWRDVW